MAESQDERWERIRRTRDQLRKLPKTEWWIWEVTETPQFTFTAVRAATVMLGWPYVKPPSIDDEWLLGSLDHSPMNTYIRNRPDFARMGDTVHRTVHNVGQMFAVRYEFGGGRYRLLLTPPVHKFCDLNKEFPEADVLRPYQFWIQPQVFESAGEVLHGAPWFRESIQQRGVTPRNLHAMLAIEPEFQAEIEWMLVALDNWLERYERTGQTEVDPRFGWTWAEERARAQALRDTHCMFVEDGQACDREIAYRYGLRTMESWSGVLCDRHAREIIEEHPGLYRFEPIT